MSFINPYNFVSTPARPTSGEFIDGSAPSFGRFHPELFSASLRVRMTTRTPLLLATPHANPPSKKASAQRHTTRLAADGSPMMLGSSLKGALRSAYEAITNSRYGNFDESVHGQPGTIRAQGGRKTLDSSPLSLVRKEHRPAREPQQLSPADRVFGWASPDGDSTASDHSAVRGRLTIDQPMCIDGPPKRIDDTFETVQLAALNGPKTSQWQFYTLPALGTRLASDTGYRKGDRLRGRKFHLPHRDTFDKPGYWTPTPDDPKAPRAGRFKEYLRPQDTPPQVAGEVTDWVVPGVVFETTINIRDVTLGELGALLWLLTRDDDAVLTLGLGKPLGFGATHFSLDEAKSRIWSGSAIADRYRSLSVAARGNIPTHSTADAVKHFKRIVAGDIGLRTAVAEFDKVLHGYAGYPVHYPRTTVEPNARGYDWWTDARRSVTLPQLTDRAPALQYHPWRQ